MKTILLVLASLFLHSLYAQLPKDIINQKCYDSGWSDETEDMLLTDDGDVQSGNLGGLDVWVVKLDTSGIIIWEKIFGGTANDWGAYLLYLENGNILAFGSTHSSDVDVNINYGYLDFWIFEITTDGEIVNSRVLEVLQMIIFSTYYKPVMEVSFLQLGLEQVME